MLKNLGDMRKQLKKIENVEPLDDLDLKQKLEV